MKDFATNEVVTDVLIKALAMAVIASLVNLYFVL